MDPRRVRAHKATGNRSNHRGFVHCTSLMVILHLQTCIPHCCSDTRQPVQLPELESHQEKGFQLHYTVKPMKHKRQNNLRQNKMHQSWKMTLVNEQSHTAINDHSYSQTSSGCQMVFLMETPFKIIIKSITA